jgi:hypothetical protein
MLASARQSGQYPPVSAAGDDADRIRHELVLAGVAGVHDFGRFVDNTTYFAGSEFDEKAAMPTLLEVLPSLTDPQVVTAVAGHLRRPWARPSAFPILLDAFVRWSEVDPGAGWALGDALATAADKSRVSVLLELSTDARYGKARQMVVYSLRRYKFDARVASVLDGLLADPSVALHAASALRQVRGDAAALPFLRHARDRTTDAAVKRSLEREIKKAEKKTGA